MIDAARLAQVIHGLRLILRVEPGGLSFFEKTYGGFVRSFLPALLLAPLHFVHSALTYSAMEAKPDTVSYAVVEVLAYVLTWTLFPFAMIYITRILGQPQRYFDYIVPYNWLQLLVGLVVLPLTLLVDLKMLSTDGAAFFNFVILGLFLTYGTFLARTALNVATSTAFGIVILDILLNLLSNEIIDKIGKS
ncbi:MAG: hypothetical protein JNK21_03330 [Rhodospirillaceae bacterium]|nr:hypothetical protein [Rhodospirillaceae bacterium]